MIHDYKLPPAKHGLPITETRPFIVDNNWLVFAASPEQAIEFLVANAKNVIAQQEAIATDADKEKSIQRFDHEVDEKNYREIVALKQQLQSKTEEMDRALERHELIQSELTETHASSLAETIASIRARIKEIEQSGVVIGGPVSKLDLRVARMQKIVEGEHHAKPVPTDRAIPVSYFDDKRDVTEYVP
jgi:hypothetical protein